MSAIAGVFSRRGAPRRPGEIDEMLVVMASRGPDGTHMWTGDRITLGHSALHSTPESVGEQMPLTDPLTGNVVVADVRLDNRPELIAKLGLGGRDPGKIGDGRLLLDAYRTWGEDCVYHLLGDFAFALWDARRQQLFLARDHFGAKPLTYHSSGHLFAFASNSRSVVGLKDVPKLVNRDRVFDLLVGSTQWTGTVDTLFEQVQRLPPAHTLTVSAIDQRSRRYWHLPEPEILRLRSDAEYEEATREVLDLAVSCRLRGRSDAGIVLSGGIDSSSITAMALGHGPVRTYSAVAADDQSVETSLIELTAATLPLRSRQLDKSSVHDLFGDFTKSQQGQEYPTVYHAILGAAFGAAQRDGCRSVLTGVLADEVVAISARDAAQSFLADRRPDELVRLLVSSGNIRSQDGTRGLVRSALVGLLDFSGWQRGRLASHRRTRWEQSRTRAVDNAHLRIASDEARRLDGRLDQTPWRALTGDGPGSLRHRMFDAGYAVFPLEGYDRTAAACSVECRSPFMDRRVVEFFQRLPTIQCVSGGWTKSVLRRSMTGHLPSDVVWNRDKPHLGSLFTTEWVDVDPEEYLRDLPADHPLHDFVAVTELLGGPKSDTDRPDQYLPYLCLSLWLQDL